MFKKDLFILDTRYLKFEFLFEILLESHAIMHFLLSASVFNVHFIREIIGMVMASMSIRTTMFMREGEQNKIIYNCHP